MPLKLILGANDRRLKTFQHSHRLRLAIQLSGAQMNDEIIDHDESTYDASSPIFYHSVKRVDIL
jgi:hypothetical protein